ncbi:MAG: hypothetical protein ACR2F8_10435, partial [Caulobacteraceae bacterium]
PVSITGGSSKWRGRGFSRSLDACEAKLARRGGRGKGIADRTRDNRANVHSTTNLTNVTNNNSHCAKRGRLIRKLSKFVEFAPFVV